MDFTVTVTEDPNVVLVREHDQGGDRLHRAAWNDEQELSDVVGDPGLLAAALFAWDGSEGPWEISAEDLATKGGGFWSP